ncbi:MAG: glycosyltransferase family 2 protein, partial [bacterium]|nr:glycosyltransferase family 2 protein [bacterium]
IKLENPKSVLELIQNVEYNFGILFRKLMGSLDAIQVTPGPFSIFRKKVFDDLGPYKYAYLTEDLEIAFRMHEAHYRIVNSHKAYVRTVPPKTLRGLYRQRLRWVYGFLRNSLDYRHLFFKKQYGNFGMFTMPAAVISIFSVLDLTVFSAMNASAYVADKVTEFETVGMPAAAAFRFDWFFVDTGFMAFMAAILLLMVIVMIFLGKLMAEDLKRPPLDVVYFMLLYGFIVPVWLSAAVYKAALSKKVSWR